MQTYIVERIEWIEGPNPIDDYKENRRILHSFLELEAAKNYVVVDSGYYHYKFDWDNWTNRAYVGYEENEEGAHGVRYQIRLIPHK